MSDQRSFNVSVDPSKLEAGKYHFGEISAYDTANVSRGGLINFFFFLFA
jgi:hypothetical protein